MNIRSNNIYFYPNLKKIIRYIVLLVFPFILFLVFKELFRLRASEIFIGFDGGYILNFATRQLRSDSEFLTLNSDFLSSLGHIYYPTNFKLYPSFWFLYFIRNINTAKASLLSIELLELSCATYLFVRTVGLSRAVAVIASSVVCICLFPFFGLGLVFSLLPVVPHIGDSIAAVLLMVVVFWRFGRYSIRRDWPWAVAFIGLSAWCVFASMASLLIAACFLALTILSAFFACNRGEIPRKAALIGITSLLFLILGPGLFLAGLTMNSVGFLFPKELGDTTMNLQMISIFFHKDSYGMAGPILVIFAILGAGWSIFSANKSERVFAWVLLLFFFFMGVATLVVFYTKAWKGPEPFYLEIYFIPLYATFAVQLVKRLLERASGLIAPIFPKAQTLKRFRHFFPPEFCLIFLAIAFAACLVLTGSKGDYGFKYPPDRSLITDLLVKEISLQKGTEFRGRVVTLTGRSLLKPVSWFDLHTQDVLRASAIGNEHRVTGLNYFHIPNLFPYGPTLSPGYFVFSRMFFARQEDVPLRNIATLRKIDPRMLAMIGIRYFITDAESDPPTILRQKIPSNDGNFLFLYEIEDVNTGQFSPVEPVQVGSIDEAFNKLKSPDFNPHNKFIVYKPWPESASLLPAKETSLVFEDPSLHFRASSEGISVVLLPIEYSNCLAVQNLTGNFVKVFRANVLLTAVMFEKRVDIRLLTRTGPIHNPGCLLADREDLLNEGVSKIEGNVSSVP